MAKPRVFISSTFYDLKHIRNDLELFIENLGYEAIRNESGHIPYGKEDALEQYCYKEINGVDILISIIGGRFGSSAKNTDMSISQKEFSVAIKTNKQVYIFVEKNVLYEYETYIKNRDKVDIEYASVDNVKIFEHLSRIKTLEKNNNIKGFETITDITIYLKEQLAGLFQQFLEQQSRAKEYNLIDKLESTSKTLNNLVELINKSTENKSKEIELILMLNHPIIDFLKENIEGAKYNFYILKAQDLNSLLYSHRYTHHTDFFKNLENNEYLYWTTVYYQDGYKFTKTLYVNREVFDLHYNLIYIPKNDWNEKLAYFEESKEIDLDEDIPF